MSQKTELRLRNLEQRLDAAEKRILALVTDKYEEPEHGWRAVHRGHGRWLVAGDDGTFTGTEWLSREEAKDLAEQMNEATEGVTAAGMVA